METVASPHPHRHQLSRRRGYRKPADVVSCARPGRWGNPFVPSDGVPMLRLIGTSPTGGAVYAQLPRTRAEAVEVHWQWLTETVEGRAVAVRALVELAGRRLACWCRVEDRCHCDNFIRLTGG